jgi:hypothetical protein
MRYSITRVAATVVFAAAVSTCTEPTAVRTETIAADTTSTAAFARVITRRTVARLDKAAGDGQTGTVNAILPTTIAVIARNRFGNPVPRGTPVAFTVGANSGAVSTGDGAFATTVMATTDSKGVATARWRLDAQPGANTLTASVPNVTPVAFSATGQADAATQLVVFTAPNSPSVSGAAFTTQPAVQRRDQFGNPVLTSGVSVTASVPAGYALVGNASATTAATGTATFTDLGVSGPAGSVTITFSSGSLTTTASVSVTATSLKTIVVHNSGSSTASGTVTSNPGSINCTVTPTGTSGTCSQSFTSLTSVTLTETPSGGGTFSGWQGACTGSNSTCTLSSVVTGNQDVTAVFGAPASSTYSRDFSTLANQNPISDGGAWTSLGRLLGVDWDDVAVTNGVAHGVYVNSQLRQYADPTALLGGVWSPNQEAEAVIKGVDAIPAGCNQEVELRLRSRIALHSSTGYEVLYQMKSPATTDGTSYISVVRWNGPPGDWTTIYMRTGYDLRDGDRIRARIVGSTISVYLNDVLQDTVVDGTYATGSPGMGFYISPFNVSSCFATPSAFGLTSFTARNLP